jgi:hypothetical protein
VTWSCSGGSITTAGLYTAPTTAGTYTVTVTSQANTSKYATATVTVTAPTIGITISPTSASLATGGTKQFTDTVTGTTNTAVTWSCSGGSITTSGLYTAPTTAGTYTVTVTSQANTSKTATATVTVTSGSAQNLILNGGFESGTSPWTGDTSTIGAFASQGLPAHTGNDCSWFYNPNNTPGLTRSLAQQVTLPSSFSRVTLTAWVEVESGVTGSVSDTFQVQVLSGTTVLGTYQLATNLSPGYTWFQVSQDLSSVLSAYKGMPITLKFIGSVAGTAQGITQFLWDDVTLNVQ